MAHPIYEDPPTGITRVELVTQMTDAVNQRLSDADVVASLSSDEIDQCRTAWIADISADENLQYTSHQASSISVLHLLRHLPLHDVIYCSKKGDNEDQFAQHAVFNDLYGAALWTTHIRRQTPWGRVLDDEIINDYVLPCSVVDERRGDGGGSRGKFHEIVTRVALTDVIDKLLAPAFAATDVPTVSSEGADLIAKSVHDITHAINAKLWGSFKLRGESTFTEILETRPLTEPSVNLLSPQDIIVSGTASQEGFSILLINALRSMGIPCRLVLVVNEQEPLRPVPRSWVEVYDGRVWFHIVPGTSAITTAVSVEGDNKVVAIVAGKGSTTTITLPWSGNVFPASDRTAHYKSSESSNLQQC